MNFSIYQLKSRFQRLLQPLLRHVAAAGISPNQLTLGTAAFMLAYGACLAWQPQSRALWAGLPAVLLARMALNALDGMLAKSTGHTTRLGALLNEVCDQASDAALYLPFALAAGVHGGLAVAVVTLAGLTEFAGLAAVAVGSARRFDGPMGKSDRAFAFGLLALMWAGGASPAWLNGLLIAVGVLSLWTLRNRVQGALRPAA
ncbi:MAG: CDP-alcohol phosphatidyltransferase family protein [Pseudomonadota bacterium]